MNKTTTITTILVLCAWAATAQANGREDSLLECGVQLGGSELRYKPPSAMQKRGLHIKAGFAPEQQAVKFERVEPRFKLTHSSTRSRMPAILAIARVGCSWR